MIQLSNLSSGYGKKQILFDISIQVKKGAIILLTGGNGSGKSTLLKTIFGIIQPWSGSITFQNQEITKLKSHQMIQQGIIYIPQKENCFENLSIQENLEISGSTLPRSILRDRITKVYQEFPKLKTFQKRTPFNLSGGERQLLAFAMGLIHQPKLILLDEPLAGVDKENAKIIMQHIAAIKNKGEQSIIMIEHKMEQVRSFIDQEYHLYLGRLNQKSTNKTLIL